MRASRSFGSELRRLRQEAGISLSEFAAEVTYDKGHLSKVERGLKRPSPALARRCDAALQAGGALHRLAGDEAETPPTSEGDGSGGEPPLGRRRVLAVGSLVGMGSLTGIGALAGAGPAAAAPAAHEPHDLLDALRSQFDQMRTLGQSSDPRGLIPLLRSQTRAVVEISSHGGPAHRGRLLLLASRYAEFAGWMAQEAGDDPGADRWIEDATDLADTGGDPAMRSFARVRRALTRVYRREGRAAVELAAGAQGSLLPLRIRGLAAQHEALGHAVLGDELLCMRKLEQARERLAQAVQETGDGPVLGTANVPDPAAMSTGWCLYDLGRPREAAIILDRECARLAPHATRSRARYGVRRALAHAASGEVEHACELTGDILRSGPHLTSATITADLRQLDRELGRFRSSEAVTALQPALSQALSGTP